MKLLFKNEHTGNGLYVPNCLCAISAGLVLVHGFESPPPPPQTLTLNYKIRLQILVLAVLPLVCLRALRLVLYGVSRRGLLLLHWRIFNACQLVFFTKCGILATPTGAAEIADHASIGCEKQHFPL